MVSLRSLTSVPRVDAAPAINVSENIARSGDRGSQLNFINLRHKALSSSLTKYVKPH